MRTSLAPRLAFRSQAGAALLLTLAMLVLLSGLVVTYLLTVRTEYTASKAYEGGTNARLLADTALQRVIGQIREGTTQPNQAWISQPGLIRTFDTDGSPVKSYKLYSADSLVEPGSFDPAAGVDLPSTDDSAADYWKKQPSLWTDINAPVADLTRLNPFGEKDASGKVKPLMNYPIFDGTHLKMATDLTTGFSEKEKGSLQLSLNDDGFADVEGFKIKNLYKDEKGETSPASMPVKWLYVLKDGTLVPAKASGSNGDIEVVVPDAHKLTAQGAFNGIVGRIAFWTDDESTKVNLNTASEGTHWDTPLGASHPGLGVNPEGAYVNPTVLTQPGTAVNTTAAGIPTPAAAAVASIQAANPYDPNVFTPEDATFEWQYMYMIGANKEYQRYSGHPATTCLSTIFGRQLMKRSSVAGNRAKMAEEIFKMIPRVTGTIYDFSSDPTSPVVTGDNSSKAGVVRPNNGERKGYAPPNPLTAPKLTPDGDRLYASVDEFLYNPNFRTAATSDERRTSWVLAEPDPSNARDKTREVLDMSHFFLTTNSKAPEQNAFNLPRVSIWPVNINENKRTAFDKVFAFCSTVGDKSDTHNQFYFTRENNESTSQDLSPRNQQLLNYLYTFTSKKPFGWDATGSAKTSFAGKYGTDHSQILAEIYDYIRCINLCDVSEPDGSGNYPSTYAAKTWKMRQSWDTTVPTKTRGSVSPITIPTIGGTTGGRGMGRFATISNFTFIATRKADSTPQIPLPGTAGGTWNPTVTFANEGKSQDALIQFLFLPELYTVMAGYSVLGLDMRISFVIEDFTVDVLDKNDVPIAGQTGLKPFTGVTQPSMYTNGAPLGVNAGFDYIKNGQGGVNMLLPHNYTSYPPSTVIPNTPTATIPNRFSAPPNALMVVKNAWSHKKFDASAVAYKLKITARVKATITSPVTKVGAALAPLNPGSEPVIQTFTFDFGTFTVPVPEPFDFAANPVSAYNHYVGNTSGSNQCASRFLMTGRHIETSVGSNIYPFIWPNQDVNKTLQPIGNGIQGDIRIIAGMANVPSSYFKPAPPMPSAAPLAPFVAANYENNTAVGNPPVRTTFHDMNNVIASRWIGFVPGWPLHNYTDFFPGNYRFGGNTGPYGLGRGAVIKGLNTLGNVPSHLPLKDDAGNVIDGVTNYLSTPAKKIYGDWDSGPASCVDGALCNKSDEGTAPQVVAPEGTGLGQSGYYSNLTAYMGTSLVVGSGFNYWELSGLEAGGLFSPNRQIASAVNLGSLPTGLTQNRPWQTLLFRPARYYLPGGDITTPFTSTPATPYAAIEHPGSGKWGPPDHLLLDLFWMPVVEPYPISEPFATAGKVNLNQQIVPFTNIQRDTALRAVLKSVKIPALNPNQATSQSNRPYPLEQRAPGLGSEQGTGIVGRRSVDVDNTLKQIQYRFDNNKPFLSSSEICDVPLIPKDVPLVTTVPVTPMVAMRHHVSARFSPSTPYKTQADRVAWEAKLASFWSANQLTGDNLLERPYAALYPRLTTRSNSYTVHVRVQTLTHNHAKRSFILTKSEGQPTGEFRGSYVVDRYLDPNTAGIYDVSDTTFQNKITSDIVPGQHVLGPYRFRVLSSKQFTP